MDNENKAFELTDEEVENVSGGCSLVDFIIGVLDNDRAYMGGRYGITCPFCSTEFNFILQEPTWIGVGTELGICPGTGCGATITLTGSTEVTYRKGTEERTSVMGRYLPGE